jgi:hypothetical protein
MTLMSEQALTSSEKAIVALMKTLDPDSLRYQSLEAALAFKGSWIFLAEKLTEVHEKRAFKEWGHKGLVGYCQEELHVSSATVKKLVRGFQWLQNEAPQYIESPNRPSLPPPQIPPLDIQMVSTLARAQDKLADTPGGEDTYMALKKAALSGTHSTTALNKQIKESIAPVIEKGNDVHKKRALRKALTSAVQVIMQLQAWDDDDTLLSDAESLREKIAAMIERTTEDIA